MRTCKEVHRLVAESMDRRMSLIEWVAVRLHLGACIHCRRFTRNMEFLRDAVRRFPGDGG